MGYEITQTLTTNDKNMTASGRMASSNVFPKTYETVKWNFDDRDEYEKFILAIANDILGGMIQFNPSSKSKWNHAYVEFKHTDLYKELKTKCRYLDDDYYDKMGKYGLDSELTLKSRNEARYARNELNKAFVDFYRNFKVDNSEVYIKLNGSYVTKFNKRSIRHSSYSAKVWKKQEAKTLLSYHGAGYRGTFEIIEVQ